MDDTIYANLTASRSSSNPSSQPSSRRTSTTSTTSSVSDLTQFLNRSSLTCRRTSLESRLRSPPPTTHPRTHHYRPQNLHRRPSSSSSNGSSRLSRQLSRIDSLVTSLTDSESETNHAWYVSSESAATSPSPQLSPRECSPSGKSYFSFRRNATESMAAIPDTEDMFSRHQYRPPPNRLETATSQVNIGNGQQNSLATVMEKRKERVMKPIKMRRRRKEKRKGTEEL